MSCVAAQDVRARWRANEFRDALVDTPVAREGSPCGPGDECPSGQAQGTAPVMLAARVEKLVGAAWSTIGSTTFDDSPAERITTPGTVGFAGDEVAAYVYDDFRRTLL